MPLDRYGVLVGTLHRSFRDTPDDQGRWFHVNLEVDAPAGTTVFVPAGSAHTYRVTEPSRYLIFLTPRLDRLIARLHRLSDRSELRATLAEFDTVLVE